MILSIFIHSPSEKFTRGLYTLIMNELLVYRKKIIFVIIAILVLMINALIPAPTRAYHAKSISSNHSISSIAAQ